MMEETIRRMVLNDMPASCRTPKRVEAVEKGTMRRHRRGNHLYALFELPDFRLLVIV